MNRPKVLFLCIGDSTRSQMAEALLREIGGRFYEGYVAGFGLGTIDPSAAEAMAEIGIDMSEQRAKAGDELLGCADVRYLITVCEQALAASATSPGAAVRLHWPVDDPVAVAGSEVDRLAGFRRVRDELVDRIAEFVWQNCTGLGLPGCFSGGVKQLS
jgi:arsenate reductase